ncbi:hypothetical protein CALCODRAFT_81669 [Calocera cornea HHB12733]|uniref:Uncharacterized protein n=1 Tax=Calocera cornea HHB12733 TaxID=1353952 RepID=A0A165DDW2_9BASI|nr:hypothetical protein CALCODRAFT_81669 [Calocera cornea HHB12733]
MYIPSTLRWACARACAKLHIREACSPIIVVAPSPHIPRLNIPFWAARSPLARSTLAPFWAHTSSSPRVRSRVHFTPNRQTSSFVTRASSPLPNCVIRPPSPSPTFPLSSFCSSRAHARTDSRRKVPDDLAQFLFPRQQRQIPPPQHPHDGAGNVRPPVRGSRARVCESIIPRVARAWLLMGTSGWSIQQAHSQIEGQQQRGRADPSCQQTLPHERLCCNSLRCRRTRSSRLDRSKLLGRDYVQHSSGVGAVLSSNRPLLASLLADEHLDKVPCPP